MKLEKYLNEEDLNEGKGDFVTSNSNVTVKLNKLGDEKMFPNRDDAGSKLSDELVKAVMAVAKDSKMGFDKSRVKEIIVNFKPA